MWEGIGRLLCDAAIALAEARHAPAVYLLTTTADGYFPKLGFVRTDRETVPETVKESVEFKRVSGERGGDE
jgi:N-acetylglutamate synthase-like GNAT family acetyltransferase